PGAPSGSKPERRSRRSRGCEPSARPSFRCRRTRRRSWCRRYRSGGFARWLYGSGMARTARTPRKKAPLPAPLPPETRTVGQLVAETIRLYGERFWVSLPLGLPVAVIDQIVIGKSAGLAIVV